MKRSYNRQKQQIISEMLRAMTKFSLVPAGSRILVALSGGKDSSLLAYLLKEMQSWYEKPFSLAAINVKTDITCGGCAKEGRIREFSESIGLPVEIVRIRIRDHLEEGQKPNCFLCSWNRRKAIFQYATKEGFDRVAFGHHRDDFAETALMNLFYNGEFVSMAPRQVMFTGKLTLIRPLIFVHEKRIAAMVEKLGFACSQCMCPYGENSKRMWVKKFLEDAEKETRNIKTNIFRSALEKMLTMEGGFTPKRRPNIEGKKQVNLRETGKNGAHDPGVNY